jgi:hypothetical protein
MKHRARSVDKSTIPPLKGAWGDVPRRVRYTLPYEDTPAPNCGTLKKFRLAVTGRHDRDAGAPRPRWVSGKWTRSSASTIKFLHCFGLEWIT